MKPSRRKRTEHRVRLDDELDAGEDFEDLFE